MGGGSGKLFKFYKWWGVLLKLPSYGNYMLLVVTSCIHNSIQNSYKNILNTFPLF